MNKLYLGVSECLNTSEMIFDEPEKSVKDKGCTKQNDWTKTTAIALNLSFFQKKINFECMHSKFFLLTKIF